MRERNAGGATKVPDGQARHDTHSRHGCQVTTALTVPPPVSAEQPQSGARIPRGTGHTRGSYMTGLLKTLLVQILAVSLLSVGSPIVVQAEVIGTLTGLESAQRDHDLARVSRALATAEAREQLRALGVDQ